MEKRTSSRTALLVAAYRARASRAPRPLIDDPWAARLAGDEGMALAAEMDLHQKDLEVWVAVRTAYLERRMSALVGGSGSPRPRQVVLLGAGFDVRAARFRREGVPFFEVDAPATSAEKQARLRALGDYPIGAATYVTCDFAHDDFLDRLALAGFDRAAPAVFIWEGVTCYLPEAAVRATLSRVAGGTHEESVVMFDFLGRRMVERAARDEGDLRAAEVVDGLGEPLRFGTNDILPLLYECGFRSVHVTSFDELALNLTGSYDRSRKWRFQWIAEASVAAPLGAP